MPLASELERIWMPFTYQQDHIDHPPLVIERGQGIHVYDRNGNAYIDAIGSWWVSFFGHNHPQISAAVRAQLDKIEHVLMAGCVAEPTLRLSHLLGSMLPRQITKLFFSDDGSTAVEVALKIALQYHSLKGGNQCEFVALGGAYHGDTLGAMSVGMIPEYHDLFHKRFNKQHGVLSPYCYRCPVGCKASTCIAQCMDPLEALFKQRGNHIAACIFEPMLQGAAGMRAYPAKVLKRIFGLCHTYKILTIADEVATGFGRTGKLFACEYADCAPDMMCLAKGLTGGYLPMGITAVQEHIFEQFSGDFRSGKIFNHGHTFTGNPLAASAACATLQLMLDMNIPSSLEPIISHFHKQLHRLFDDHENVGDIRTIGMVGALELVADRTTKALFPTENRTLFRIAQAGLKHGLLIRPLGNVLYFVPPFIATTQEIDQMLNSAKAAMADVLYA